MPQKLLEYGKKNYVQINDDENFVLYQYGGMNGTKFRWRYNNNVYMVKTQEKNSTPKKRVNKKLVTSYNNSVISEYVGSHVINAIDFNNMVAQNTILVYYEKENKICVACEHINDTSEIPKISFITFSGHPGVKFGNKYLNELFSRKFDTIAFDKMIDWIENEQTILERDYFLEYFYNMFALDMFILNWDRNPTNWGFLLDNKTKEYDFAPLIDQGGSLLAKSDFKGFELINNLEDDSNIDIIIEGTKSFFKKDESNKKITYMNYIMNTSNIDLLITINEFINHMKNVNIQEIIESLSLPQEYKQTYTKLLERSLFNINKFVNLNPLYKEVLKEQDILQEKDIQEEKEIKKQKSTRTFSR